jgi:hypothetical protein
MPTLDGPDWQLTVQVKNVATPDNPDWQTTIIGPGGAAIGGYASLTGPGQTATPGGLVQAGSFEVDSSEFGGGVKIDNAAPAGNGIELLDTSAGGIKLESKAPGSGGITLNDSSGGGVLVETTIPFDSIYIASADELGLVSAGGNGVSINDTGGGGVNVQTNAGGNLGFFAVGPVAQQATPVTLADVIALLQAYGLCP